MTDRELFYRVKPRWDKYKLSKDIYLMPQRGIDDVSNKSEWGYYQFLHSLIDTINPKQIIELGGAMGVACVMMCEAENKPDIYSITLEEHGLEFSYINKEYPNLHKIIGDDLDLKNWEGVDLEKTDIWFIDSLHTEIQLRKELLIYKEFFKSGAILLLDDIYMPELFTVWKDLLYDKFDATAWLHFSGFGICII